MKETQLQEKTSSDNEIRSESEAVGPAFHRAAVDPARKDSGIRLDVLLTTSIVSACLSAAATIAYFDIFTPHQKSVPPVMVVDMAELAASVAKMSEGDVGKAEALFALGAKSVADLREAGVVLIDARNVLSAPVDRVLKPDDLIPGAPSVELESLDVLSKPVEPNVRNVPKKPAFEE